MNLVGDSRGHKKKKKGDGPVVSSVMVILVLKKRTREQQKRKKKKRDVRRIDGSMLRTVDLFMAQRDIKRREISWLYC